MKRKWLCWLSVTDKADRPDDDAHSKAHRLLGQYLGEPPVKLGSRIAARFHGVGLSEEIAELRSAAR
jgi:hypothetical protein